MKKQSREKNALLTTEISTFEQTDKNTISQKYIQEELDRKKLRLNFREQQKQKQKRQRRLQDVKNMNDLLKFANQNYKVTELIGRGGYATAFKAEDLNTKEICVIKKMDLQGFSEYDMKNCLGEAKRLKQLKCKYIIGFRAVFQNGPYLCIVMDYANGGSLQRAVSQRRGKLFPEKQIWEYLYCVCQAIQCSHKKQIVHRDIKPVNILIDNEVLKLCDFGISKQFEESQSSKNAYTNYWSNIDYFSPEMLLGSGYSFPIDVWQFGIILYFLCRLKHPFRPSDMRKYSKSTAREKIMAADYKDIPSEYSEDLHVLLQNTINVDKDARWTPKRILEKIEENLKKYEKVF